MDYRLRRSYPDNSNTEQPLHAEDGVEEKSERPLHAEDGVVETPDQPPSEEDGVKEGSYMRKKPVWYMGDVKRVKRECEAGKVCNDAHDCPPKFSRGAIVLDLYSVILCRNKEVVSKNYPYKGDLSGLIRTQVLPIPSPANTEDADEYVDHEDLYFYKVKPEDADEYVDFTGPDDCQYEFTIYGPQDGKQLVPCWSRVLVDFDLLLDGESIFQLPPNPDYLPSLVFGEKEVTYSTASFNAGLASGPQCFNTPVWMKTSRAGSSLPIKISMKYAFMTPGAVAYIAIQILNKPTPVLLSGSISARPCSFTDRIPLVSMDKAIVCSSESFIELKRRVLAVPSSASLVIEVGPLFDQDGNLFMPYLGAVFVPSRDGLETQTIKDDHGDDRLQVCVEWVDHAV